MKTKIIDQTPNTHNYKIVEYDNRFQIFVEEVRKVGVFKKKLLKEWVRADIYGLPTCHYVMTNKEFDSLEKATEQIISWKKGTITHQLI